MARRRLIATAMIAGLASTTGALADDNIVNFIQDGSTHSGVVVQTGISDQAGTATLPVHQEGVFDDLTLTQSGNENTIGLAGHGLVQDGTASTDGKPANTATIIQNSNGNAIGEVVQTTLGAHPTTGNTLSVTQDYGLGGGPSGRNTIGSISQVQDNADSANFAVLTQTGSQNWLGQLSQHTSSGDGANHVTLVVTGNYNGIDNSTLAGPGALAVVARSTGVASAAITQGSDLSGGAENTIELTVTGDYNQFGLTQLGTDNSLGETITGSDNSFGAYQQGKRNQIVSGGMVGDSNDVGTRQIGDSNAASAVLNDASSDNEVGIGQSGDTNTADLSLKGNNGLVSVSQNGNRHHARITTVGDRNVVMAIQYNAGQVGSVGDTITVNITGTGNNGLDGGAAQSFTGAALTAASPGAVISRSLLISPDATLLVSSLQNAIVLVPGLLLQSGEDNTMNIDVGATATSDDNLFAAEQKGSGNLITASVNGSGNQFVVTQQSDDNTVGLNQFGEGNIAAISQ